MANTITNILDKILAQGLLALREQAIMARLVNVDYSTEAARKGQTIDIPVAPSLSASDVTPAPVYSSAQDSSPGLVQVQLNNWKHCPFYLTDKELVELAENEHFMPMNVSQAIRQLANAVDTDIHAEYVGVYGFVGTAGTTPFVSTVDDCVDARKVLAQQLAPRDNQLRIVLDPDAEANATKLAAFSDVSQTQDRPVKIEGEIGRKFGFDFFMSQNVQTHTAGTAQDLTVASTTAAGSSTIGLSASVAGSMVVGDVFTIAGDTQTYVVKATVASVSSNTAVTIDPALKAAATSGAAVTLKASHVVNLAFHREAFALATRPLRADMQLGSMFSEATDPISGLSLRLEVSRQFKQVTWDYDILWGAKIVRPEYACRIAG